MRLRPTPARIPSLRRALSPPRERASTGDVDSRLLGDDGASAARRRWWPALQVAGVFLAGTGGLLW